ncbi:MAG TPA: cupin domain-containing protein [Verrucomicrobiae bacterium]|nr:cupin domain-containing protein [Verrucomicrobiae bacterium]
MAFDSVKWDEAKDGVLNEAALRRKIESLGYSVTRHVYPPGTYFPDHIHGADKIDAVVSGRFLMTTREGTLVLEAGDYLEVPKKTVHRAEVLGRDPVVSLDAIRI